MKALIEGPFGSTLSTVLKSKDLGLINKEVDAIGVPLDAVHKTLRLTGRHPYASPYIGRDGMVKGASVHGGEDRVGFKADLLHNIDFPPVEPPTISIVAGQHPNG